MTGVREAPPRLADLVARYRRVAIAGMHVTGEELWPPTERWENGMWILFSGYAPLMKIHFAVVHAPVDLLGSELPAHTKNVPFFIASRRGGVACRCCRAGSADVGDRSPSRHPLGRRRLPGPRGVEPVHPPVPEGRDDQHLRDRPGAGIADAGPVVLLRRDARHAVLQPPDPHQPTPA